MAATKDYLGEIGSASKQLRKERELSLRDAAKLVGVSHKALWRVEARKPVLGSTLLKVRAWVLKRV